MFAEEETNKENSLVTRRELIARNCVLEQNIMDTLSYGFNTIVEQLKIIKKGSTLWSKMLGPLTRWSKGRYFILSRKKAMARIMGAMIKFLGLHAHLFIWPVCQLLFKCFGQGAWPIFWVCLLGERVPGVLMF